MFSKFIQKSPAQAEIIPETIPQPTAEAEWENRLKAALGDDQALLALAAAAPSVEQKLICIQELTTEDGLKAAEREFRKHDRRVHSLAKQRFEAQVKQRETRTGAAELIKAATALLEAPLVPANRLAEINQAWEALDTTLIIEAEKHSFAQLQNELAELIRTRGEHKRAVSRWSVAANQALAGLCAAGATVTATSAGLQGLGETLAAACENARATLTAMPENTTEDAAIAALVTAIESALQDAAVIREKLLLLEELHENQNAVDASALYSALSARWQTLPQIADKHIINALNARFDEYLQQQDSARKKLQKQSSLIASKKEKAVQQAQIQSLLAVVEAAEALLAAGNLLEVAKQLTSLQSAAEKGGIGAALQTRIGALQAEFTRLKGWQHWGGGRVRDDLVVEAEALAATTVVAEGERPPKLQIKQLDTSIEQLRLRWKELDRLGGATNKPLWQRFEAALRTAYMPVAAHLAQLKEARQENLTARKNLLNELDAINIAATEQQTPDWIEIKRALAHFQVEWRKLGPLEHTAPHKSQPALLERMKASVARLETPLKELQVSAEAERLQLIERAKALGQDAQRRDMMVKLRELQTEWQVHAKSQPLPRKTENQLWSEFKAATDALMSQREAAFSVRDAEYKANQGVREALIERLEALHPDTTPAEIKRTLASVESEWNKAGEAPRSQAARLDASYRAAREAAQAHIAGSAQRSWQQICDALSAKLALCAEMEATTPTAELEARWNALPALPTLWEQALQVRYKSEGSDTKAAATLDQLLLQLESSLDIPSPAAFQLARRTLKLMAMKNAMEERRSATPGWQEIEKMTAAALRVRSANEDQQHRLASIIAALRKAKPAN